MPVSLVLCLNFLRFSYKISVKKFSKYPNLLYLLFVSIVKLRSFSYLLLPENVLGSACSTFISLTRFNQATGLICSYHIACFVLVDN